ncbi:unnamed protein product [Protopolystoma xenopodis]|uniref:Uncharacterized protein n=1 Tax=Protopolystoma xenopodis TaxID=117903 RepID=A0A3S5A6E1_9PLAT|nr:unnamed protein product [Protopolystoma xenopodis]
MAAHAIARLHLSTTFSLRHCRVKCLSRPTHYHKDPFPYQLAHIPSAGIVHCPLLRPPVGLSTELRPLNEPATPSPMHTCIHIDSHTSTSSLLFRPNRHLPVMFGSTDGLSMHAWPLIRGGFHFAVD